MLPIPQGWTSIEAATLPENLFTVYDNLVTRARLAQDETVLIHGGASGIGSMASMLARAVGAVPIATAGSDEKCAACRGFGAAEAINYKTADFVAAVLRFTGGRGVDVVLDIVGASYLGRNLDALATDGRLVFLAPQSGSRASFDIVKLMQKRGAMLGSTLRVRTPREKGAIAERLLRDVWPLLPAKNPIRPAVDSTFPLREAWRAHERLERGLHTGKIVLVV